MIILLFELVKSVYLMLDSIFYLFQQNSPIRDYFHPEDHIGIKSNSPVFRTFNYINANKRKHWNQSLLAELHFHNRPEIGMSMPFSRNTAI